jgi:kynurenine formamidase
MQARWDSADERGARNLIGQAATLRGLACVRTGEVVPLALPIENGKPGPGMSLRPAPHHFMLRSGADYAAGLPEKGGFGFSDDVIMLPTHGSTHIDALSHVWCQGHMYNGFAATEVTSRGAARCGIENVEPIVTRAVFVDLGRPDEPTRAIGVDELAAAVAASGVAPEAGDALVIRTGWMKARRAGQCGEAESGGLHHDCAPWIVEQGFALVAADNIAVEVVPSRHPKLAAPLHLALLRDNGIYLAELLDLERLAGMAARPLLLIVAPLAIKGGVGSPVTPVAVL